VLLSFLPYNVPGLAYQCVCPVKCGRVECGAAVLPRRGNRR
jgi:hypothetical protein